MKQTYRVVYDGSKGQSLTGVADPPRRFGCDSRPCSCKREHSPSNSIIGKNADIDPSLIDGMGWDYDKAFFWAHK